MSDDISMKNNSHLKMKYKREKSKLKTIKFLGEWSLRILFCRCFFAYIFLFSDLNGCVCGIPRCLKLLMRYEFAFSGKKVKNN